MFEQFKHDILFTMSREKEIKKLTSTGKKNSLNNIN